MPLTKVQGAMITSAPAVTVYTSGSGTYTTPANCAYLLIEMVGGGGGGGYSGSTGNGTAAGNGGTTTFGTSLLTCLGGNAGGINTTTGPDGGIPTLNSPAVGLAIKGTQGNSGVYNNGSAGGQGGCSPFLGGGGSCSGSTNSGNASAGLPNTGGGGGGAGGPSGVFTGSGGGSGGYIKAYITSPSSSYAYSVGAGGTASTAGTSGYAGGAGGSGVIYVTAFF